MEELKPCPFCGGELMPNEQSGRVTTMKCSCPDYKHKELTEEKFAEWWNARPIEDALRAENERLRGALERIARSTSASPDNWIFDAPRIAREALSGGKDGEG